MFCVYWAKTVFAQTTNDSSTMGSTSTVWFVDNTLARIGADISLAIWGHCMDTHVAVWIRWHIHLHPYPCWSRCFFRRGDSPGHGYPDRGIPGGIYAWDQCRFYLHWLWCGVHHHHAQHPNAPHKVVSCCLNSRNTNYCIIDTRK